MSRTTFLIGFTLVISACYSAFVWQSTDLGSLEKNCQQGIDSFLAPWDSGCRYTLDFDNLEQPASSRQIELENSHLNTFKRKEGVVPNILWYRAKFNREYMNEFRQNFEQLHYMHIDYTLSEHARLDRQVDYLVFLNSNDLVPLAQETLDLFCKDYLRVSREDVLEELDYRLKKNGLVLNLEYCIAKLHVTSRNLFLKNRSQ